MRPAHEAVADEADIERFLCAHVFSKVMVDINPLAEPASSAAMSHSSAQLASASAKRRDRVSVVVDSHLIGPGFIDPRERRLKIKHDVGLIRLRGECRLRGRRDRRSTG